MGCIGCWLYAPFRDELCNAMNPRIGPDEREASSTSKNKSSSVKKTLTSELKDDYILNGVNLCHLSEPDKRQPLCTCCNGIRIPFLSHLVPKTPVTPYRPKKYAHVQPIRLMMMMQGSRNAQCKNDDQKNGNSMWIAINPRQ